VLNNNMLDHEFRRLEEFAALFTSVLGRFLLTDMRCGDLLAFPARQYRSCSHRNDSLLKIPTTILDNIDRSK
jgi:hypothetical protein